MKKNNETPQQKLMGEIRLLLEQDLSYIFGEKECGPNGIKKQFLDKSAHFLKKLAAALCFINSKVNKNASGIACSGEVTLYGMWSEDNGVMLEITQPFGFPHQLLFRRISRVNDFSGQRNQWIPLSVFKQKDYDQLKSLLLNEKRGKGVADYAA